MRRTLVPALAAAAAVALPLTAGAATAGHMQAAEKHSVAISTRKLPKLGTVLVDSRGRTLYMFVPDKRKRVTCVGTCAAMWPPVKLPKRTRKALARGKARARLLRSDRDPAGGRVVTYAGWPLYTYVGDGAPGSANGQALNVNGGLWYVLSPSGKVIRKKL